MLNIDAMSFEALHLTCMCVCVEGGGGVCRCECVSVCVGGWGGDESGWDNEKDVIQLLQQQHDHTHSHITYSHITCPQAGLAPPLRHLTSKGHECLVEGLVL